MSHTIVATPSPFEGEDGEDAHAWARKYEFIVKSNKWSEKDALFNVAIYLEGQAVIWWEELHFKPKTFNEFKQQFLHVFASQNEIKEAEIKLKTNLQKEGERVSYYI